MRLASPLGFTALRCRSTYNTLYIGPAALDHLTSLLDLPPSYGGIGLQSLEHSAGEELSGSFAGIAASLVSFCRNTELPVYIAIVEALEAMGDSKGLLVS